MFKIIKKFPKRTFEMRLHSSEFKVSDNPLYEGLPVANIGYGFDASSKVDSKDPEAMFYPTKVGFGKIRISYILPNNAVGIDTKQNRLFTITRRKTDRDFMTDAMYPIFNITQEDGGCSSSLTSCRV